MKLSYHGRKPKHTAGKTKKSRCPFKKHSSPTEPNNGCGCWGKKLKKVPFVALENEKVVRNSKKWKKSGA